MSPLALAGIIVGGFVLILLIVAALTPPDHRKSHDSGRWDWLWATLDFVAFWRHW